MQKAVQRSLFEHPTFNTVRAQKVAMAESIRASGFSRDEVVDRMNDLADRYGVRLVTGNGHKLTIGTFEKWINPSDLNRQMPMRALPIFCGAVKSTAALDVLAQPLDCRVINSDKRRLLEWAELYIRAKRDRKKMRQLEEDI